MDESIEVTTGSSVPSTERTASNASTPRLRGIGIALWCLAPLLLALSVYRPFRESTGRAAGLPTAIAGFERVREYEIKPQYRQLLGTGDAAWRAYREIESGRLVFVTAVFHEENWKSVHPPHICLEGSDMTIEEDGRLALRDGGEPLEVGRILTFARKAQRHYLSLYLFGTASMFTADYSSYFWHHAPAAVLRQATSGFLLRVETYVATGDTEDQREAERICGRLIRALSLAARERL